MVQDVLGTGPRTHELTFTDCVRLDYETRVRDDVWPRSWPEEFVNDQAWLDDDVGTILQLHIPL